MNTTCSYMGIREQEYYLFIPGFQRTRTLLVPTWVSENRNTTSSYLGIREHEHYLFLPG
ncbi:hypothetical protein DPMN_184719 [Dreissena polymorpha]|uniref:Uncharacterized protein n=1 Tax=Dreissena polymorpha TaxID=45954 RepID=A0A9D4DKV9_DREPO|nr:hypothetical protein DPMN_184719 [Dreissena polymorpha]